MSHSVLTRRAGLAVSWVALIAGVSDAWAREGERQHFEMSAQPLGAALQAIARQTGRNVIASTAIVADKTSPAIVGDYTADEATNLAITGYHFRVLPVGNALVVRAANDSESAAETDAAAPADDIVVTGSRIRGAHIASPVITVGQQQIRDEGLATLGDVVRTLPQSFGGGQNPGVGFNVPAASGVNVGGATSINLRGIGSDATLTLLNGHRLSYSASRQSIDVSSIPLGAVDRIEIVPDGASALYGSDAVAGVANIILKPDYDGVETRARLGAATDGGDFEQRYSIVAGHRWDKGGIIATYEFGRDTAVFGKDRSYTADRPALVLFPSLKNHSATLSAHQDISPDIAFSIDALFNQRSSSNAFASNAAGDTMLSGARLSFVASSFVIAPTVRAAVGSDWHIFLTGSYGQDHTHYDVQSFSRGTVFNAPHSCYCNNAKAIEAGGDGSVFALPGGEAKLAIGAGYRSNKLVRFNGVGADTNVSHGQESYYGYGELSLPLIGAGQGVALVHDLTASAALRYERYTGVGKIATPKVGLIYAPTADFAFKGSWT